MDKGVLCAGNYTRVRSSHPLMPVSVKKNRLQPDQLDEQLIASAQRTLDLESEGLRTLEAALADGLSGSFAAAVRIIHDAPGRVIVTGIGKSGHVAQKVASTLASTGTPAYFVHPSEASHGDLGMITADDVVLAISWSGETAEFSSLITYAARFAVPLIAVTSRSESTLARASVVTLILPCAKEACPHGLAPTTSTLMQLALGDCLALALLECRGFSASDFKELHPGGQLGASLKFVSDIMHSGERVPLAGNDMPMGEALVIMTEIYMDTFLTIDPMLSLIPGEQWKTESQSSPRDMGLKNLSRLG